MAPSVLIIGASGTVGRPLVQEFLKNKTRFKRLAVLADPAKVSRFEEVQSQGVELVVGSFLEASSYKGIFYLPYCFGRAELHLRLRHRHFSCGKHRHEAPARYG
jgi:nucleoside-diphosphate-sugar epimerase